MKYYIDFDHTLYNTNALIEDMLTTPYFDIFF